VQSSRFAVTLEIYGLSIRVDISWSGRITFFEVTSVARANISSAIG